MCGNTGLVQPRRCCPEAFSLFHLCGQRGQYAGSRYPPQTGSFAARASRCHQKARVLAVRTSPSSFLTDSLSRAAQGISGFSVQTPAILRGKAADARGWPPPENGCATPRPAPIGSRLGRLPFLSLSRKEGPVRARNYFSWEILPDQLI